MKIGYFNKKDNCIITDEKKKIQMLAQKQVEKIHYSIKQAGSNQQKQIAEKIPSTMRVYSREDQ